MPIDDSLSWPLVYAFFHPETRPERSDQGLDAVFGGLVSSALGISTSASPDIGVLAGELPSLYDGIPTTLVFEAYEVSRRDHYWRAQIEIVTGVAVGENVVVNVTNANGDEIEDGELVLLGTRLRVVHGLAIYNLAKFQQNLDNTEVSLTISSGEPIAGTLKLGEEMLV